MTQDVDTVSVGPISLDGAARRSMMRRAVIASTIGTTIEWYDFFLYGIAAALVFPRVFFPQSDPFTGTLLAFSTYFVGFVARPLGAVVFGHFGDRIGRKGSLIATLLLMGIATIAIGLVPGHDRIGIWGGVLLVVARALQGIGVGGEWGGSILLAGEWADPKHRGFAMSWPAAGGSAGLLLSNGALGLVSVMTTEDQFLSWGWRIPFLASVVPDLHRPIHEDGNPRDASVRPPPGARQAGKSADHRGAAAKLARGDPDDADANRSDCAALHFHYLHPDLRNPSTSVSAAGSCSIS